MANRAQHDNILYGGYAYTCYWSIWDKEASPRIKLVAASSGADPSVQRILPEQIFAYL